MKKASVTITLTEGEAYAAMRTLLSGRGDDADHIANTWAAMCIAASLGMTLQEYATFYAANTPKKKV